MSRTIELPNPWPGRPAILVDLGDPTSVAVMRDREGNVVDVANNYDTACLWRGEWHHEDDPDDPDRAYLDAVEDAREHVVETGQAAGV